MDANERRSMLLVRHSDQRVLKRDGVSRDTYAQIYDGAAPWEVGRPQPAIVELEAQGKFRGKILDVGCGTGDLSLFLASKGYQVLGIDFVETAVARARKKAQLLGAAVRFEVRDVFELKDLLSTFDTVLDSATFHAFSDAQRARYERVLRSVMNPGATLHLLAISDQEPYTGGPRHVSQREIRECFTEGWHIASIRETRYLATIAPDGGARAWLAEIHRHETKSERAPQTGVSSTPITSSERAEAAPYSWSFTDFVLCRRGALPFAALAGLSAHRAVSLLADAERAHTDRTAVQDELLDRLHAVIPESSPDRRRILIGLKRDLFNGRVAESAALEHARAALADDGRVLLDRWLEGDALEKDLYRRAEETAREDVARSRITLARLACTEDLMQGLQLSSLSVYRTVAKLAREGTLAHGHGKRVRHARATLVSYLYRMALKTSPFATFTELSLQRRGCPPIPTAGRRRLVRLSRDYLTWIEREIVHHLEECWEALPHAINNTARVSAGKVEFFVSADETTDATLSAENVLRITANGPIRALLEELAGGPSTGVELVNALSRIGCTKDAAGSLIQRLVQLGLLERSLGLPDHDPDYGRRMVEAISRLPGVRAAGCATALAALCDVEDAFPAAEAARRSELLADARRSIERVAASIGIDPPAEDDARSYVYEDVASAAPARSWNQELVDAERDRFALLQRLLPLFDDSRVERHGLYDLFAAQYGPAGSCDDLLAFYQVFAKQTPAAVSVLMTGAGQPWARELDALRREFCDLIDAQLAPAQTEGRSAVTLDQTEVERLVGRFPAYLDGWGSAAYGLQFCRIENAPAIVVNSVFTGYGGLYSRFCELFEPPRGESAARSRGPTLRELVAARIHEVSATERQVDLTAVLGMNANLHPALTDLELIYPRCRSTGERAEAFTLRDLVLVGDPVRRCIRVLSRRNGEPLRLLPHNFLFPGAAATLYRFLCAVAPVINHRGGLWSKYQMIARGPSAARHWFPRLQLGRIVLDRQTWTWPVTALPPAPGVTESDDAFRNLVDARGWQRRLGLPGEGFFRFHAARSPSPEGVEWVRELRSWALAAHNNRLRKPHYVDFTSPLLTSVLFKQLRRLPDAVFRFQECLPATTEYLDDAGATSAEEHVVQLDQIWPREVNTQQGGPQS